MLATDSLVSNPATSDSLAREPLATQAPPSDATARRDDAGEPGRTSEPDLLGPAGETVQTDRNAALRALRSLEATEARLQRNAKREIEDARGKLVQDLLPVLDNLERTIRAAHHGRSDPAMLEGVRLVRHQLEGVLRGYGVERIEALDQRFDPGIHEAIGVNAVSDPRRHGVVVQQAEPGYRFGGRLLRPAKVHVGKHVAPAGVPHRPHWSSHRPLGR